MKSVSIIIPAFDEERTIASIIRQVAEADTLGLEKEIIVVDDGSSDSTAANARRAIGQLGGLARGRVVVQATNGGKATALVRGFLESTGDLLIVQDADLEYDPADLATLLRPILGGRADVVMGSRFIGGQPHRVVYYSNAVGNRFMSAIFSLISGMRLTDIHCCYMMLPGDIIRAAAPTLHSERWGFNPEICSLIADWRDDLRVVEVGISYYGRSKGDGKKIRFRHGLVAIAEILRYNLRPRRALPVNWPPADVQVLALPATANGDGETDALAAGAR